MSNSACQVFVSLGLSLSYYLNVSHFIYLFHSLESIMSKRGPTSELNHDNWDQEDDVAESAGDFKQANTDELKKRVILQAKRKSASSSADSGPVSCLI